MQDNSSCLFFAVEVSFKVPLEITVSPKGYLSKYNMENGRGKGKGKDFLSDGNKNQSQALPATERVFGISAFVIQIQIIICVRRIIVISGFFGTHDFTDADPALDFDIFHLLMQQFFYPDRILDAL